MKALAGVALLLACIASLRLTRARDNEPVGILKSDSAQSAFMMSWLVAFIVGSALIVQHFGD